MGVALLGAERCAALNALVGVADGTAQRFPARAETERADHQSRIAEDGLRLGQTLSFDTADEPFGRDVDIFQEKCRRVAGADTVLVFRLAVAEAGHIALDDEP